MKDNLPISVVSRTHSFEEGVGPNIYVDPIFADQELRELCMLYPVEALEGELKSRVWANSVFEINGITHKTWLLTEEYLYPHPETKKGNYHNREYSCPRILRELFEYLYPKYIKCNLAQFVRIFCFDGNILVPVVWYGKLKDLFHLLIALEKYLNIIPSKVEKFIRLDSRDQSKKNKWWKPAMNKSLIEMKSKSSYLDESDLCSLKDEMSGWIKDRSKGKLELRIPNYMYSPSPVQFLSLRQPLWIDAIPRTVIYAREKYLYEELLESTIQYNKRLDEIANLEAKHPLPEEE